MQSLRRQSLRRAAASAPRIRFLWSTSSVPTSGNPPVKRPRSAKLALLPDFAGKGDSRIIAGDQSLGALLLHGESLGIMVWGAEFRRFTVRAHVLACASHGR